MPWLQVTLRADRDEADRYATAFEDAGALAVSLADAGDEALFETTPVEAPLWSHTRITALFPADTDCAALRGELASRLGSVDAPPFETELVADQDWERAWMDRFQPMHFGGRLWVVPSWHAPPDPEAVNIVLDPGLAFGTGTHATTALCLEWLADHPPRGREVLDYGCGSGILAIAALKLGARRATGVDIDARALVVSRENAERNAVADRLALAPPAALPPMTQADVVLANILAAPLMALAPTLAAHVRPGGWLVMSGLLLEQTAEVSDHYREGFHLETRVRDGWVLLAGRKRQQ